MSKLLKIPVFHYGDGWKPLPGMCPMMREEPECNQDWCVSHSDTGVCECVRRSPAYEETEDRNLFVLCSYNLTEAEDRELCDEIDYHNLPENWEVVGSVQGEPHNEQRCSCGCELFLKHQSGPHLGLFCGSCGKWQKWLQQEIHNDPNFIMPFGEHKKEKISLVPTDYLLWGTKHLKGAMKRRFELALEHRGFMFLTFLYEIYDVLIHEQRPHINISYVNVSYITLSQQFIDKHPQTTQVAFDFWFDRVRTEAAKYPMFEWDKRRENWAEDKVKVALVYHPDKVLLPEC